MPLHPQPLMLLLPPFQLPLPKTHQHLHLLKPPKTPPSFHTIPTPTSPLPIAAIPLAMVGASSPPAPLDKGKGVVIVPSSDEEDTVEGPVFKRRRTTTVAKSHSTSNKDVESLREHPPSVFTTPNYRALGEGAETAPEPTSAPAPELPRVVQHLLNGFQQVLPEGSTDEAMEESVIRSLGGYLSRVSSWRQQTETKATEYQALAD